MSDNSFGKLFRVTTWGESHGPAIGCVVDGCPPRLELSEADIQPWLDRRKPGQSRFTTQRKEADQVRILSGVFEGKTTGTPISLMIENTDQRSKDYGEIAQQYRPGHADIAYDLKYGIRDYRGGGRSSARETAMRVAAGAVARVMLKTLLGADVKIRAALTSVGGQMIDPVRWDWDEVERNPLWCPDPQSVEPWEALIDSVRKDGSSIGATVEVVAEGLPAGLGAPVYGKLDGDIASALMGINGVKGVEIGDGFAVAALRGEQNADPIKPGPQFESNHAGGILGGIATGQPIVARFAIKPTSSILIPVPSINSVGDAVDVRTKGRHDPCIGIRAVPVAEAMIACVLADHLLRHYAQCGW
ncbi:chorismate synthase [Swingsia samuiensis]|uniref:Chorismate synthase n=1 Tax=Swingsia samuiensis TaxID=1293412 RepID=A0A4Y6UJ61_9PROT|nr:chorismate synthase [Swingsia samuiensis]QDH17659.1 chorismate synthase [Swingsia samuiensis]